MKKKETIAREAFRQSLAVELFAKPYLSNPTNAVATVRHVIDTMAKFRTQLDTRTLQASVWEMVRVALLNHRVSLRGAAEDKHDFLVDFEDGNPPDLSDAKYSQRGSATTIRFDDTEHSRLAKAREYREQRLALVNNSVFSTRHGVCETFGFADTKSPSHVVAFDFSSRLATEQDLSLFEITMLAALESVEAVKTGAAKKLSRLPAVKLLSLHGVGETATKHLEDFAKITQQQIHLYRMNYMAIRKKARKHVKKFDEYNEFATEEAALQLQELMVDVMPKIAVRVVLKTPATLATVLESDEVRQTIAVEKAQSKLDGRAEAVQQLRDMGLNEAADRLAATQKAGNP